MVVEVSLTRPDFQIFEEAVGVIDIHWGWAHQALRAVEVVVDNSGMLVAKDPAAAEEIGVVDRMAKPDRECAW